MTKETMTKAFVLIRTSVPFEPTHSQKVDVPGDGPSGDGEGQPQRASASFTSLDVIESIMKVKGVVEASRIYQTSGIKDLFDVVAVLEVDDREAVRRIVAEQIEPIHGVRWTNAAVPI